MGSGARAVPSQVSLRPALSCSLAASVSDVGATSSPSSIAAPPSSLSSALVPAASPGSSIADLPSVADVGVSWSPSSIVAPTSSTWAAPACPARSVSSIAVPPSFGVALANNSVAGAAPSKVSSRPPADRSLAASIPEIRESSSSACTAELRGGLDSCSGSRSPSTSIFPAYGAALEGICPSVPMLSRLSATSLPRPSGSDPSGAAFAGREGACGSVLESARTGNNSVGWLPSAELIRLLAKDIPAGRTGEVFPGKSARAWARAVPGTGVAEAVGAGKEADDVEGGEAIGATEGITAATFLPADLAVGLSRVEGSCFWRFTSCRLASSSDSCSFSE
mmetsp:Transcript_7161/g.11296  ORF Transcript_7161/g.11296 Transcript_7161/m.11296 type:complete len:336 (+) Transcript_7161:372-1379(+)